MFSPRRTGQMVNGGWRSLGVDFFWWCWRLRFTCPVIATKLQPHYQKQAARDKRAKTKRTNQRPLICDRGRSRNREPPVLKFFPQKKCGVVFLGHWASGATAGYWNPCIGRSASVVRRSSKVLRQAKLQMLIDKTIGMWGSGLRLGLILILILLVERLGFDILLAHSCGVGSWPNKIAWPRILLLFA